MRYLIRKRKRDKEYGISRGIDFQCVDNVVLFDFPTTVKAYIHCIGRLLHCVFMSLGVLGTTNLVV